MSYRRGVGATTRRIAALAALVLITIGVPFILARLIGWPLPRSMPDWSDVGRAIRQGDIPSATVVKGLAVVVWLLWAQVMWSLVWEFAVNVPRISRGEVAQATPLAPKQLSNSVARLVALVMSIGISASSTAAAAALPAASPTFHALPRPAAVATAGPVISTADHTAPRWTATADDSLWGIAEAALGDGARSDEILDLNSWLRSPRDLKPGQILNLPADATVPPERAAPAASALPEADTPNSDGVTYLSPTHMVIQVGDNLWNLSRDRLAQIDDDVTPRETLDYLNDVIAANPDVVEDPNLIYPGEVFQFPAIGNPPPEPEAAPAPAPEPAPVASTAEPPSPEPTTITNPEPPAATSPAETVDPAAAQPAATDPVSPTTIAEATPTPPAPPPATKTADTDSPSTSSDSRAPAAPWVLGITGATTLATGLLLLYRRRLRARAARAARAYRDSAPDDPTTLAALTRAADVSLLRWANHELADLFQQLGRGDIAGEPLAVELSEAHGIELLWTEPNPVAPRPWEAGDDGWSWRLIYDPDLPLDRHDNTAVLPALVTIGSRDSNQLLLNLEAVGVIDIEGDTDSADGFLRSVVAELGTGELLSDAYIVCTDIHLDGLSSLDRIQRTTTEQAIQRATTSSAAAVRFLADNDYRTAFESRLGGDADGRETLVIALGAQSGFELDPAAVPPGTGVCAVAAAAIGARSTVRIQPVGAAVLEPWGIEFDPVRLPVPTVEAITMLLDEAIEPYSGPRPAIEEPAVVGATDPTEVADEQSVEESPPTDSCEADLGDDDGWTIPTPAVMVRVLGAPEVLDHPNIGRIETSIITYLACHDGKRRDDQVINAVWNGRAMEPKTLFNKISKIRSILGSDLVPARSPGSPLVVLDRRVATDLSVLKAIMERADHVSDAEAVDLLLHGLSLIDGPPFDSSDCEWCYETQTYADATETVEAAALKCAATARRLGDLTAARAALADGLRALPMNEPLYRARMLVEADGGNSSGVQAAVTELRTVLQLHSESGLEFEPETETTHLAETLTQELADDDQNWQPDAGSDEVAGATDDWDNAASSG